MSVHDHGVDLVRFSGMPDYQPCGGHLVGMIHRMGHENAGWVQVVGASVKFVKPGDAVICPPFPTVGESA